MSAFAPGTSVDGPPRVLRLRVCHIITQLELGGAQRNTLYTLAHLDRERFEPSLVCGCGGLLDGEAAAGDWNTTFLPALIRPVRPWSDVAALIALYRHLRQARPHVVHTHSSKAGILGRLGAWLAGVPVIVHTFHGFGFTPTQRSWVWWLTISLERLWSRITTHLIYVSEDNRVEGAQHGFRSPRGHSLIRSGVSLRLAPSEGLREEIGVSETAWLVACVNNFKPQKNTQDLIQVALALVERDQKIHVAIAGDGPGRAAGEAAVRDRPGSERIHFLGWRQDARRLLAGSDAFLLTSLWEGLPRALVEAFAEGRPAVAYAVNGVNDVLKNGVNGYAIPPRNTAEAVERLLWLKNHPSDARQMGRTARLLIQTEFDIDRMLRQQEVLYERLFRGSAPSAHDSLLSPL